MSANTDHDEAARDHAAANTDEEKSHGGETSDSEETNSGCLDFFLGICVLWALLERACSG